MRVTVDPTSSLTKRRRGAVQWLIQPGLPPVVTLSFAVVFLFMLSLMMNIWFQIIIAPVVGYFVFLLGRAYEKRTRA